MGGTGATFTGPATWTGGTITGAGTTIFDNTLAISGNTGKSISGTRIIDLNGTTTWGGNTGNLGNGIFFNNGTINNAGTFNDTNLTTQRHVVGNRQLVKTAQAGKVEIHGAICHLIQITIDSETTDAFARIYRTGIDQIVVYQSLNCAVALYDSIISKICIIAMEYRTPGDIYKAVIC